MRILLDMDGPCADWLAGIAEWFTRNDLNAGFLDFSSWNAVRDDETGERTLRSVRKAQASSEFYRWLPPVFGFYKAVFEMEKAGHDVWFCSTPDSTNSTCADDKIAWIERWLGTGWGKRLILTHDKTLVAGDILIDDKPDITGSAVPVWEQVVWDMGYNREVTNKKRLSNWADWRDVVEEELPPLIGLGGRLRSGKDTVADHLVAEHGFVKMGMSDPLNDALLKLDPIVWPSSGISGTAIRPRRYADYVKDLGYTEAKKAPEVRRLLQILGTEVARDLFGEDVWVNIAIQRIQAARRAGTPVVLTGVRFANELQMIRNLGGTPVWIHREGIGNSSAHASENGVHPTDFSIVIDNSGTLEETYEIVDNFFKEKAVA